MRKPFYILIGLILGLVISQVGVGAHSAPAAPARPAVTTATPLDPDDVMDAISAARGDIYQNARWDDLLINSMGDFNSSVQFGQTGAGLRVTTLEVNGNAYFQNAPLSISELPTSPTSAEMEANLREIRAALLSAGVATH